MDLDFAKRMSELSRRSYNNGHYVFSDFLSMSELSDVLEMTKKSKDSPLYLDTQFFSISGGHDDYERGIVRFGNKEELMYEEEFPIVCLKIEPLIKKFSDNLSHRDFLGALMNLGIERTLIGDILVKNNECYIFVKEQIQDYIINELSRVKHTSIKINKIIDFEENIKPETKSGTLNANSLRIDGFIAKLHKLSRNNASQLFVCGKVFVNGRCCQNESTQLKEGDSIVVRGYGRAKYLGLSGVTKKGNMILSYEKYI